MAEDCRFGSCSGRQSPAVTQMAARLPKFTISPMKASCPYHEAAYGPTAESLIQWAYALNCMDCKTNHGYIETYINGKDFLSHGHIEVYNFDQNYADMVDYYKRGGDFLGDVFAKEDK